MRNSILSTLTSATVTVIKPEFRGLAPSTAISTEPIPSQARITYSPGTRVHHSKVPSALAKSVNPPKRLLTDSDMLVPCITPVTRPLTLTTGVRARRTKMLPASLPACTSTAPG